MDVPAEILAVFMATITDVLPIAAIIFGFQFAVLRQAPANLGEILIGFLWVLVGLSLFLLGLKWCLFPLPIQKQVAAVWEYDMEVCNGGHSQYFFNSSGSHWRDALKGLEAIGANHDLELLRAAVVAFEDPPSEDTEERTNHLIAVLEDAEEEFDALDDRYYKDPQTRKVLWVDYALQHPEAFQDLEEYEY